MNDPLSEFNSNGPVFTRKIKLRSGRSEISPFEIWTFWRLYFKWSQFFVYIKKQTRLMNHSKPRQRPFEIRIFWISDPHCTWFCRMFAGRWDTWRRAKSSCLWAWSRPRASVVRDELSSSCERRSRHRRCTFWECCRAHPPCASPGMSNNKNVLYSQPSM